MIKKLFSYASAEVVAKGLNWATIAVLPLIISTSEYGQVGLLVAIEGLLSMVLLVGQEKAVLRFQNQVDYDVYGYTMKIAAFTFLIAVGGIVIAGCFADSLFGVKLFPDLFILLISIFFFNAIRLKMALARINDDTRVFWISRLTYQGAKFLAVVALSYLLGSATGYIYGCFLAAILASGLLFLPSKQISVPQLKAFSFDKNIKFLILFGWPFIFHALSGNILSYADRFFIEGYLNKTELGVYTFAYTIGSSLTFLFVAISAYFEPLVYKHASDQTKYKKILRVYYKALIGASCFYAVFLIIFFNWYTKKFLSADFQEGIGILYIIIAAHLINPLYLIANFELTIYNATKLVAISTLIAGLINILFNILLIPRMGVAGAAYSTLISYVALSLIGCGFVAMKNKTVNVKGGFRNVIIFLLLFIPLFFSLSGWWLVCVLSVIGIYILAELFITEDISQYIIKK